MAPIVTQATSLSTFWKLYCYGTYIVYNICMYVLLLFRTPLTLRSSKPVGIHSKSRGIVILLS